MKAIDVLRRRLLVAVILSAVVLVPRVALAHAVLVASTPSGHATVKGPEVTVHLTFNSRIDSAHSRLYLVDSGGKTQMLTLARQDAPDSLAAESVKLNAGQYVVHWQVLAADGHITRGQIPFVVQ